MMDYFTLIKKHEGLRLRPYRCTKGKLTIGWGRNIDAKGLPDFAKPYFDKHKRITREMADMILAIDVADAVREAKILFKTFDKLCLPRQAVTVDMLFQMGMKRVSKFKKTIAAVNKGDWQMAYKEMLDSDWYRDDTPERAEEDANIMQRGQW